MRQDQRFDDAGLTEQGVADLRGQGREHVVALRNPERVERGKPKAREPSQSRPVGALVIITMENYLAQLGAWVTIVQGIIFVVCVLTFRRGVVGEIAHFLKKPL